MRCIDISDDQMVSYVKQEERKSLDSSIVVHIDSCETCRARAAFLANLHAVVNVSPSRAPSVDELTASAARDQVVNATKPSREFRILKFASLVSAAAACIVAGIFLFDFVGRKKQVAQEKEPSHNVTITSRANNQDVEALVKDLSTALNNLQRVMEKQNSQMAELSAGSAQIAKNLASIEQSNKELREGYENRMKRLEQDIAKLAAEILSLRQDNERMNARLSEAYSELASVKKQLEKPNYDLDGDGVVSRNDLRILEEAILTESENVNAALDLNKDGKVDSADFLILTRMVPK